MPGTRTRVAFAEDGKTAEKDLAVARLTRLSLTLDFPASQYEVLENADEACEGTISQFIDKAVNTPVSGAETNPHEPECSQDRRDSPVATH